MIEHGPLLDTDHLSEEDEVIFKQFSILLPTMSRRKKAAPQTQVVDQHQQQPQAQVLRNDDDCLDDVVVESRPADSNPAALQNGSDIPDTFGSWSPFGDLGMLSKTNDQITDVNTDVLCGGPHFLR